MMERLNIRRLLFGGLITLLCAQLLYAALMLSALYKQYQEPVLQVNGLLCKDISDHLSLLVRVGKSLRASTLERYLAPYHDRTNAADLLVTNNAGKVLYRWEEGAQDHFVVPSTSKALFSDIKTFDTDDHFWVASPITDKKGGNVGNVLIAMSKSEFTAQLLDNVSGLLKLLLILTVCECLLLGALIHFIHKLQEEKQEKQPSAKFKMRLWFMFPFVVGQILFLILLFSPLSKLYQSELYMTGRQVSQQIVWDLKRITGMGLPISGIHAMDSWLQQRLEHVNALGIAVHDEEGQMHCAVSPTGKLFADEWKELYPTAVMAHSDIVDRFTGSFAGSVSVAMDSEAASRSMFSVMLDNLTVTIIVTLFLGELLFLLLMGGSLTAMASTPDFMRPIIFACLFATEMSMAYVPIRIGELGLDLFGLPPDLVSGLPISCELFMAGAAMFIGGFWSQRSGWRPMLFTGLLLCLVGSLLSWISTGPLPFILSRGFCGLGYGFINLSAQVFVIVHSNDNNRARNLAFMFAGLYAGSLCGSAMGGLIADRLGYGAVFPTSAILLVLLPILLWKRLPVECWIPTTSSSRLNLKETISFLTDRRMGSLLLFFIIPNALITVCLCQFFVPLSLSQSGTSPATIGRVFLVYSILVMFAGPYFGGIIDKARSMVKPLFASQILAALSVLALVLFDGVEGTMACMTLLAISTAIASNGQGAYALSLPASDRFGRSRTMGFYNVAMRLGQVFGPLSLGILMTAWDARTGLTILTVFTGICALLFVLFSFARKTSNGTTH